MKKEVLAAALLVLALAISKPLTATPLNLQPVDPDIYAAFITASYDAGSGILHASGWTVQYVRPPEATDLIPGAFVIDANVDPSGNAATGSLSIGGYIPSLGAMSGVLLTGSLTAFGFTAGTAPLFEFMFAATGGDLLADFGGIGAPVGVILHGNSPFSGFGSNYTSAYWVGTADAFSLIPEPATLSLLAAGLGALAFRARRRHGRR